MKRYAAIFFDLYGTLVDIHTDESKPILWSKAAAFYTDHGAKYSGPELRAAYQAHCTGEERRLTEAAPPGALVELELRRVFAALYEQKGAAASESLIADTAWLFRRVSTSHLRTYAGARELLTALRKQGREVVLLSNAQACFTGPELDLLKLTDCFDRIFISSDVGYRKPDPRFFLAALQAVGADPADCLMIGNDPACDLHGAAGVGMDAFYIHSALSPQPMPNEASLPAIGSLPKMDLRALCRMLLS